jgi:alginate O-acetyltransferase complex protein AlgI
MAKKFSLLFAMLLLLEEKLPMDKIPRAIRHIYVLLVIMLSFVLFNAQSMTQVGSDFRALFGFADLPAVSAQTLYYLRSYSMLFLIGFVGATPLPKTVAGKLEKTAVGAVLEVALLVGLLLVCSGYLVDGSFSPFLYFRF